MASLEQEIETVREQLDRQVRLKSRLERMKAQQAKLNWEVGLRKERWHQEEQDIDQLEACLLYTSYQDEKLEIQQRPVSFNTIGHFPIFRSKWSLE